MAKTQCPAERFVILDLLYYRLTRFCLVGVKNATSICHVSAVLATTTTSTLDNAWVEPFGRPLVTFLTDHIDPKLRLSLLINSRYFSSPY